MTLRSAIWNATPCLLPIGTPNVDRSPAYRTDIYKVYGLTPRELRRIERRIP